MCDVTKQNETRDEARMRVLYTCREAGFNPAVVPLMRTDTEEGSYFAAHTEVGTISIGFVSEGIKIDWSDVCGVRQYGGILDARIRRRGYGPQNNQVLVSGCEDLRRCLGVIKETLS